MSGGNPTTGLTPAATASFWRRLLSNLTFQVLLSIAVGIGVGHFQPETAVKLKWFADAFIGLIKWFIGPIIFTTVTLGVGGAGDLKRTGRIGGKALLYFEVVTTIALLIGMVVSGLIQPGAGISAARLPAEEVARYAEGARSFTWAGFFLHNLTLQVLLVALVLGGILSAMPWRHRILERLEDAGKWVFVVLRYAMRLAPLGALGGMAFTVGAV